MDTLVQERQNARPRNQGMPLALDLLRGAAVNLSAVERRVVSLPGRRTVKKEWQAAWLVKALQLIDLTTLAGDDTPGRVHRLCAKARRPLRADLLDALGLAAAPPHVAAVCVYPAMVTPAVQALAGSGIPVASVAAGFPAGQTKLPPRLEEIRLAVADGAEEIDIVISRAHVLTRTGARCMTRCGRCARPAATRISRRSWRPATCARCATCTRRAWWR